MTVTWRVVANTGVGFGLTVSTWANVAQSWDHGWGARAMAAVWPTIVYLAIEVLARTPWGGTVGKWVARLAALLVGLVAAYVSYQHLHGLMLAYGYDERSAMLGPFGIDGVMVICAAALLSDTEKEQANTTAEGVASHPDTATQVAVDDGSSSPTEVQPTSLKPVGARRINGRDLRVTEAVKLIRDARDAGEPDPSVNAVARALNVKWDTAKPIHVRALAEIGKR